MKLEIRFTIIIMDKYVIKRQTAKEIKVGHKKQLPNKEYYRKVSHEKLFEEDSVTIICLSRGENPLIT